MAQFLSPEWIAEIDAAASGDPRLAEATRGVHLVVQQVVNGTPAGDVRYVIRVEDGSVRVASGEADDAHVTFTQDWDTAVAMSTGELSAQDAFTGGRLWLKGDVTRLMENQAAFADLDQAFVQVRENTTY
jgi:alkyl sulfatase BDS1-like metallo-beta-lactamase superfamily hydrolase